MSRSESRSRPTTGALLFGALIPPIGQHQCRGGCGITIERFGLCDACGERMARKEHAELMRPAIASIPDRFAWARLTSHANPAGAVLPWMGKPMDRLLGYRVVVIAGGSGTGKTSLACALLRAHIDAGAYGALPRDVDTARRCRFVAARKVPCPVSYRDDNVWNPPARHASVLLLDDVGQEAANESFRANDRSREVGDLLLDRHDAGKRMIVTTGLTRKQWLTLYSNDGLCRRYFDSAPDVRVIDLNKRG